MVREVGGEWRFDLVIWLFVGYKMEYCVEEGLEWVFGGLYGYIERS